MFLTAFDFNTSVSLTTTISQMLYRVLGMQITWSFKMGNYVSEPFSDGEYNFDFPYYPTNELSCFDYKVNYISEIIFM